jgi:hypothetical protein
MTGLCHHTQLLVEMEGCPILSPLGWPQTVIFLTSASQVPTLTGVSHLLPIYIHILSRQTSKHWSLMEHQG